MTSIRRARLDDAGDVADLTTQLGYPTDSRAQARRLAPLVDSTDDAVLVAVDGHDRPIGWIHVGRSRILEQDEHAVIKGLVVADGHRSKGIGVALVSAAEAWAVERKIARMIVRSRITRARAHGFYEREGYRLTKTSHVFEKRLM